MLYLGDPHHFGKRVHLRADGKIHKPRPIFWEWLLLDRSSPLSKLLGTLCEKHGVPCLQQILPEPAFSGENNYFEKGEVECLRWMPASRDTFGPEDFESMGRAIALLTWLGVSDLLKQNIAFGVDLKGKPVFGPVDVECVLGDFALPMQTHLLPISRISRTECGMADVFYYFAEYPDPQIPAAVVYGYLQAMDLLAKEGKTIFQALLKIEGIDQARVRLIARNTREYYGLMNENTPPPHLSDCEKEQLDRKDIPYYFRNFGSLEIFYHAQPDKPALAALLPEVKEQALKNQTLDLEARLSHIDSTKKAGALEILKAFAHTEEVLSGSYKDLSFNVDLHSVSLRQGELNLQARRGKKVA